MTQDTSLCARLSHAGAATLRLGVVLAAALALPGCARLGLGGPADASAPRVGATTVPQDPVAAFAAQSQPGAQGRVTLANGQPVAVRLVRGYAAASGRECREVLVSSGSVERSQLICTTEDGSWAAARPLLRGGGTPRS